MISKIIRTIYSAMPESTRMIIRNTVWKFHLTKESKSLFKFYSSFIKKGDLVFDIGTNYGNHSSIFLELGAKVVCLEPNPKLIPLLGKRFGSRAIIINKGVSSKNQILKFNSLKDSGHSTFDNSTIKEGDEVLETIHIETTTLKDLINHHGIPQFIKIDVEGFEYEVLKTLEEPVKNLSFEFNLSRIDVLKKCLDHLKSIGYKKFNFSYDRNFKLELPSWGKEILSLIKQKKGDVYVKI